MPAATATARSVCLVSLGCSKNLVDSEVMVGHLGRAGLTLVADPAESDVVIVNTCGFIEEARDESLETIRSFAALKREGALAGLVVTGCLVQLHRARLQRELPEVDAFLPLSDYSGVPSIVDALLGHGQTGPCPGGEAGAAAAARTGHPAASAAEAEAGTAPGAASEAPALPGGGPKGGDADLGRALLTPLHTAYLRLGEGCNHVCAFCAIPAIRGKLQSKPLQVLLEEASALASLGTRELTLIAEDSTDWGKDLGTGQRLPDLLEGLGTIDGLEWVRVMYAHPATIDERLIDTLAAVPNLAPYLDLPVQHGDADVLRAMRRGTSPERIRELVGRLRAAIPDITLRTTILTGFPGETEAAFARLLELLEELRFDRVGCFTFSPEMGTEGAGLPDRPPRELAEARREAVMRLQRQILEDANRARVGTVDRVLIDAVGPSAGKGAQAVGRTVRDAPEIDGEVLVTLPRRHRVAPGDFLQVRLTGVSGYDLLGTPAA